MTVQRWAAKFLVLTASSGWLTAALVIPSLSAPAPKKINFSKDVLPILSDKCFKCHGPDSATRMAGMRLDRPDGAYANLGGVFPIVPFKPEHSLIVKKITDKDDPMPPHSSGKFLTDAEKQTLTDWIAQGGKYDKLWSFVALPATVPVPQISSTWPKQDLDKFVLNRLRQNRIAPNPPASRERWLRRVTLDLNGLPPTEAEIAGFVADKRPDAYERVVDRLLASPHYGEHIAVDWLDAARYADSYGYQSDLIMPVWPYRDWVIKAFNQNMPYNEFLIDQLAGDLLPNATRDQRLATAFNRVNRQSNEGGSIPLEFQTSYASDRTETFGTAVLGLTVGCCKCHDHKFDQLTQKEYYQLFAYFNSIDEAGLLLSTEVVPVPSLLLPTPSQESQLKVAKANDASANKALSDAKASAEPRLKAWMSNLPKKGQIPGLLARYEFNKLDGSKFANDLGGKPFAEKLGTVNVVKEGQVNAAVMDGDNGLALRGLPAKDRWDPFTWSLKINELNRPAVPTVLMHRTGGTDVGFCGFDLTLQNGYLTARVFRAPPINAVTVRSISPIKEKTPTYVAWSWDGSGHAKGLKIYLDGKPAPTEVLSDTLWKKINAYGDLGGSRGDWAIAQRFRDEGFRGEVSDVQFADRALSDLEVGQLADGHALTDALQNPTAHANQLRDYFMTAIDPSTKAALVNLQKAQHALADVEEPIYEVPVMQESKKPIPAYLLARGNYDAPRNASTLVHRGVPKALPPLNPTGKNDRLALAKWVTEPNHPLTARVAVNRLWQMMFGSGIVETSENFGVQGSRPTHPQLLDYLARRFVNSGWDVKALLRTIALSATYRQESSRAVKGKDVDPANYLMARGPSHRLSAEELRDSVLAASGLMYDKLGGAPVNPYQPAGLWTENNTMSPDFVQSKGKDLYRRTIYTTWKRTAPIPSMLVFDATARESCIVRRPATNTPLQALVLLNDVQFVEASRVLAELVLKKSKTDTDRIQEAFRRLSGREATKPEMAVLTRTLNEQRKVFEGTPADAAKLIKVGDSKASPTIPPVELAAMTVTVQTIMNSDSFVWER